MQDTETVFIIDDDDEVRHALRRLMVSIGLNVIVYASANEYLEQFNAQIPGCILLDIRMPGMSGLALQEHLQTFPLSPPVIIITGHGDVPMAVQAIQNGAIDFIQKPFNDQLLLESIHKAIEIDATQRGRALRKAVIQERVDLLTDRETQVMEQVVAGKRNKVIAFDLGITQSTVEAHRAKVMEKMQAKTLSDLMRMLLSIDSPDT
ncbi:MAG: Two-component nitrogen fixation transcriptional regulator FixJ [uncultured Thiotrichaceae bacterium]|uniref:Two-component nitrogen fixation transcriptional regulator FixJ n=1 Tax=uncultured Thiotrichaceae bacterium TaxID=298394 RepID=A0A6S6U4G0_9GAMM|nr:MAG: Two-component nitrogen fixation transcriptional regulator FixJ [uncultured Thiotrichaceae bacterium]